jgi:hypothetical protein
MTMDHLIINDDGRVAGTASGDFGLAPGQRAIPSPHDFDISRIGSVRAVFKGDKVTFEDIIPPAPPIEMLRAGAVSRAMAIIGGLSRPIRDAYTQAEVDSWPAQAAEARAVAAGGGPEDAPTLAMIAAARGVTLAQIAASVIANASQFSAIMVAEQGLRRQAEAAIAAATTPTEIDAVLADLREQVMATAQAMGGGNG